MAVAHQPKDMIKECIYTQKMQVKEPRCLDLMANGSTKIFTPKYGVCYMFNFNGLYSTTQALTSFYPGEEYGLQLTLDAESKV